MPSPLATPAASVPAEWWQIVGALSPLAVLFAAIIAAWVGLQTLRQRRHADAAEVAQRSEADNRAEWWRRTQWALDNALEKDENTKALGLATLSVLTMSDLAREEELLLLDIAWKSVAQDTNGTTEDADSTGQGATQAPIPKKTREPATHSARRVQVAAAKLRVVLDERLGRPTPAAVKDLAKEDL